MNEGDGIFCNVFHELFLASRASIVVNVLRASRLAPTKHDSGFHLSLVIENDGIFDNVFFANYFLRLGHLSSHMYCGRAGSPLRVHKGDLFWFYCIGIYDVIYPIQRPLHRLRPNVGAG